MYVVAECVIRPDRGIAVSFSLERRAGPQQETEDPPPPCSALLWRSRDHSCRTTILLAEARPPPWEPLSGKKRSILQRSESGFCSTGHVARESFAVTYACVARRSSAKAPWNEHSINRRVAPRRVGRAFLQSVNQSKPNSPRLIRYNSTPRKVLRERTYDRLLDGAVNGGAAFALGGRRRSTESNSRGVPAPSALANFSSSILLYS